MKCDVLLNSQRLLMIMERVIKVPEMFWTIELDGILYTVFQPIHCLAFIRCKNSREKRDKISFSYRNKQNDTDKIWKLMKWFCTMTVTKSSVLVSWEMLIFCFSMIYFQFGSECYLLLKGQGMVVLIPQS